MEIGRLGPGDEEVVSALATREPRRDLLEDERAIFLAALAGDEPVISSSADAEEGFVLTEPDNDAVNALYRFLGGTAREVVQWNFGYRDA